MKKEFKVISDLIVENSKVLDVGCGDGELIKYLLENKTVNIRGLEISKDRVQNCLSKGLTVIEGDAENDLKQFPDTSFDYVVLSQTLQAFLNPENVMNELLRVGKKAIVSIPNFGHWKVRLHLLLKGTMPVTENLPNEWYNTPNLHMCTIKDFENYLGTIFTEARLKQFVEIRTLDTCDWNCICNGPAFFTGLIYGSLEEAYDIIKHWKKVDILNAYLSSTQKGLDAEIGNKKLLEWGKVFLSLAKKGLEKRNELNSKNNNETIYLKHIEDILDRKKNRAQLLLEQFNKKGNLEFFNYNNEDFSYSGF